MRKLIRGMIPLTLVGVTLVCGARQVHAQATGGRTSGGNTGISSGSTSGSTSGTNTFSGSSLNTSSNSNSSSGSTNSANASYGSTSFLGNYYYTPQSYGKAAETSSIASNNSSSSGSNGGSSSGIASSISSSGSTGGSSSSSSGNITSGAAQSTVKFGQAMYNVNPVSTFTSTGTATIKSQTTNTNQSQQQNTVRPAYAARLGFKPDPVPVGQVLVDFRQATLESPSLSNQNSRVQIILDGDIVVLRGIVQDDHDREVAETMAMMTPGVRGVRNELAVRNTTDMSQR